MPVYLPRKPLPTDAAIEQRTWRRRRPYAIVAIILLVLASLVIPPFAGCWRAIHAWRHQLFHSEVVSIVLTSVGPPKASPAWNGSVLSIAYIANEPMAVVSVSHKHGDIAFSTAKDAEKFASSHALGTTVQLFRSRRDPRILWISADEVQRRGMGGAIMITGFLAVCCGLVVALANGRSLESSWGRGDDFQTHDT